MSSTVKPPAKEAPLSFEHPSRWWCTAQALRGTNWSNLSIPDRDMKRKWIIISGSNNGIGREAALQFARWGANLILACRRPPAHEMDPRTVVKECIDEAKGNGLLIEVEWWEVDMADLESVEGFAQRWLGTGRPLHVLCNNAGLAAVGPLRVTKDGFELTHQVNFISHVLLTHLLLPSLAKAREPRIICTTSCHHFLGIYNLAHANDTDRTINTGDIYGNSKLYFQTWVTEMQHRLLQHDQYKHVTINGVNPGYVRTGIWTWNVSSGIGKVVERCLQGLAWLLAISPQQGSLAITNAATSEELGPDPRVQGVGIQGARGGGLYVNRIWIAESMPHCRDLEVRERVWRKCDEELGLRGKGLLDVLGGARGAGES